MKLSDLIEVFKRHDKVLFKLTGIGEDVAEEYKGAYKDIDFVISQELDLVKPIKKLKTIGVVKG